MVDPVRSRPWTAVVNRSINSAVLVFSLIGASYGEGGFHHKFAQACGVSDG